MPIDPKFEVYLSNQVESLLHSFKENIFFSCTDHPLTRRMVIVSSQVVKSWLMLQLAKDPSLGIAAGLEIYPLEVAMEKLRVEFSPLNEKKIPSHLELSLALELELRKIGRNFSEASLEEQNLWRPLLKYLHLLPGEPFSRKCEQRLIDLAAQLASLFRQYGKYGSRMLEEWERTDPVDWQQKLWQQVFYQKSPWTYLYRELNENFLSKPQDFQIHLFSISYLSPLFYHFLERFSKYLPVRYYALSPCQYFWSDIRSDKETRRLSAYWKSKGVHAEQQEALEDFLRDRNPLLANFGRLGREMAGLIENSAVEVFEDYGVPERIKEYPQWDSLVSRDTRDYTCSGPLTLLQAVQADMLLLRHPDSTEKEKLNFDTNEDSFQVHCSCTRLREVQALYDLLIQLIIKHQSGADPISPEDILVMAPTISDYEPCIKAIFQKTTSQLAAHLIDACPSTQSQHVQSFLILLSIACSRWDSATLLQLFDDPAFQKKQHLTQKNIDQLRYWIKETGICWGINAEHRSELLERDHCLNAKTEQSSLRTWEEGFNQLLAGLAVQTDETDVIASQRDLLKNFLEILNALRTDLNSITYLETKTLADWVDYLQRLHATYFVEEFEVSDEGQMLLRDVFFSLKKASKFFAEEKFSFSSLKTHLKQLLNYQKADSQESRLNAVTFCSLLPLRMFPAKVIVLLGLQEGKYPRRDPFVALNQMRGRSDVDYLPSQIDFDRYLFLETLLSARNYFVMSYLGYSEEDFKEQLPSLLVTEVLNYLDQSYRIQGDLPSKRCFFKHPLHSFDSRYFDGQTVLKSYSLTDYRAALSYYRSDKQAPPQFISSFEILSSQKKNRETTLDLAALSAYAKNPLKTYLNRRLGIYLKKESDRMVDNEEPLLPSRLDFDRLKKMSLRESFEDVLAVAEKEKLLPPRIFKEVAIETLWEKVEEMKNHQEAINVHSDEVFSIELSENYSKPEYSLEGKHWQFPPLRVKDDTGGEVIITGKLNEVTPQGLMEHIRNEQDVTKSWPRFLVFQCLIKEYDLPIKPHLLFMKSGLNKSSISKDPRHELSQYVESYFSGLETPCFLFPEWIPSLIKENPEHLIAALKELESNRQLMYNNYLEWFLNYFPIPHTVLQWKMTAQALFGTTFQEWFGKRKGG